MLIPSLFYVYSKEGELVFGVAHIFASFNDTFVHVTDLSGKETIARVTGKLYSRSKLDFSDFLFSFPTFQLS